MKTLYHHIPDWCFNDSPSVYSFFETISLLKLENVSIKLTSNDQHKLLGCNLFGKQTITVVGNTIQVSKKICFGNDYESYTYGLEEIKTAIQTQSSLKM